MLLPTRMSHSQTAVSVDMQHGACHVSGAPHGNTGSESVHKTRVHPVCHLDPKFINYLKPAGAHACCFRSPALSQHTTGLLATSASAQKLGISRALTWVCCTETREHPEARRLKHVVFVAAEGFENPLEVAVPSFR